MFASFSAKETSARAASAFALALVAAALAVDLLDRTEALLGWNDVLAVCTEPLLECFEDLELETCDLV